MPLFYHHLSSALALLLLPVVLITLSTDFGVLLPILQNRIKKKTVCMILSFFDYFCRHQCSNSYGCICVYIHIVCILVYQILHLL